MLFITYAQTWMFLLVVDFRSGKLFSPTAHRILNNGAVQLRTYRTFRPGSSIVANTTATCGISRDCLNLINVPVATPLFSVVKLSKFSVLYVLYCSKGDRSSALKRGIRIFPPFISVIQRNSFLFPLLSLWSDSSAGVLCWFVNELRLYWLFLYVSPSLYPMCIMVFTPFVVRIVREWICRSNKVREVWLSSDLLLRCEWAFIMSCYSAVLCCKNRQ
jgi:hypothetical protein